MDFDTVRNRIWDSSFCQWQVSSHIRFPIPSDSKSMSYLCPGSSPLSALTHIGYPTSIPRMTFLILWPTCPSPVLPSSGLGRSTVRTSAPYIVFPTHPEFKQMCPQSLMRAFGCSLLKMVRHRSTPVQMVSSAWTSSLSSPRSTISTCTFP